MSEKQNYNRKSSLIGRRLHNDFYKPFSQLLMEIFYAKTFTFYLETGVTRYN